MVATNDPNMNLSNSSLSNSTHGNTANVMASSPHGHSNAHLNGNNGIDYLTISASNLQDSDSEEEDDVDRSIHVHAMQHLNQPHEHPAPQNNIANDGIIAGNANSSSTTNHPDLNSAETGPLYALLEDLKRIEVGRHIGGGNVYAMSIEEALQRMDGRKDNSAAKMMYNANTVNNPLEHQQQSHSHQQSLHTLAAASGMNNNLLFSTASSHNMLLPGLAGPNNLMMASAAGPVIMQPPPQSLVSMLLGRGGAGMGPCILTDTFDSAVRQHQLRYLTELFPDIDFVRCITETSRALQSLTTHGQYPQIQQAVTAAAKLKPLFVRLVEIERAHAEQVLASKQKDAVRSVEIIAGCADRIQDLDDVIIRARARAEDVTMIVQRIISLI
jgi:hypothetical protein